MRVIALVLISLSLQSCYLLDAFLMTKYDPNEYKIITEIRAMAGKNKEHCDNEAISKVAAEELTKSTKLFVFYSEHIPRNSDNIRASKVLHEIAHELSDRYNKPNTKVSAVYCKIKFENVESSAAKMQSVIGSRPR